MTYERAALVCLLQGARRREFVYIYKPGDPFRTIGRAFRFHIFSTDNEEFHWKKYCIDNDYLWNTTVYIDLI